MAKMLNRDERARRALVAAVRQLVEPLDDDQLWLVLDVMLAFQDAVWRVAWKRPDERRPVAAAAEVGVGDD
jgi:hypothetical protein